MSDEETSEPVSTGRNQAGQFVAGVSGNPAGRPKGCRNALSEDFIQALYEDFQQHGPEVIAQVRAEKPDAYLKIIASILPRQAEFKVDSYDHLDDGQLKSALAAAIRDLASLGVDVGLEPLLPKAH